MDDAPSLARRIGWYRRSRPAAATRPLRSAVEAGVVDHATSRRHARRATVGRCLPPRQARRGRCGRGALRATTGRQGPGAGRPSKLYRLAADELTASIPERHYDLAGSLLAAAVAESTRTGRPVRDCLREAARAPAGASATKRATPSAARGAPASGTRHDDAHAGAHGYEPEVARRTEIALGNCPFHRLAEQERELVCGMNLDFLDGLIEGLASSSSISTACLDPRPATAAFASAPREAGRVEPLIRASQGSRRRSRRLRARQVFIGFTTRQPRRSTCGDGCFYRCLPPAGRSPAPKEDIMQGYVARKGDRYYAVIYEGIDPLTGRERRRWHPAGTDQGSRREARTRSRRSTPPRRRPRAIGSSPLPCTSPSVGCRPRS